MPTVEVRSNSELKPEAFHGFFSDIKKHNLIYIRVIDGWLEVLNGNLRLMKHSEFNPDETFNGSKRVPFHGTVTITVP